MQVELTQDWRGYRVGARFPMEVIGGGVADVLLRNKWARLLPGPDGGSKGVGDPAHSASGDATDDRASDDSGSQSAATHRRKRR